ncbi:fungal-specific transcription factor domain-containing protein [Coniochaeta sp. 2T2.1]|nr:fungal-specific transcription factor domain-containing protein [Coniochaeta sp. 2T2.1]
MSSPQSFFGADQPAERGYIQAYFDKTKSASCVFLHRPTVLSKWSQGKLDPTLLKALLAAGRRFTRGLDDDIVQPLMRDAHSAILARLNKFSVSRLQALVLVIQFRLQAGDTVEAWNLMSLAARFAFTLRLNYERPDLDDVTRESHRRLFWAIYLLDRLFASGIEDLSLCPLDRIHIRLPCDDRSFERGIASRAEYFKQDAASERCIMDPLAYLIRLYECRENILRHTKQVRREGISPAATADKQVALQAELNDFEASLPDHLQHKPQCLPIVAYSGDAHSFFLIHSIWLQCHCDLYRFFIPGIRESVSGAVAASTPAEYVDFCTANCLDSALKLCDFWSDMLKLWSADVIEETMVDVSIYQVAQVLHSLHHLLPRTGPHSIEALKSALQNTLDVVSTSRNRVSRSSPGLEAAERLVRLLGQATTTSKTRRSPQENIHHLPSHGSLIPETCSSDEAEPSRQPVQYTPHGAVMNTGEGDAAVASVGGLPQSDLIFPVRRSACLLKAISR